MNYDIKWQDGVVSENGRNGLQVGDVIFQTIVRLNELNDKYPCEENEITLHALKSAFFAQQLRHDNRVRRGVEGKNIL